MESAFETKRGNSSVAGTKGRRPAFGDAPRISNGAVVALFPIEWLVPAVVSRKASVCLDGHLMRTERASRLSTKNTLGGAALSPSLQPALNRDRWPQRRRSDGRNMLFALLPRAGLGGTGSSPVHPAN